MSVRRQSSWRRGVGRSVAEDRVLVSVRIYLTKSPNSRILGRISMGVFFNAKISTSGIDNLTFNKRMNTLITYGLVVAK